MDIKFLLRNTITLIGFMAIACNLISSPAFCAPTTSSKGIHKVKLLAGYRNETYADSTEDEAQDKTSTSSDVKVNTIQLIAGGVIRKLEIEIDYRIITPKDTPYWSKSSHLGISFSRYFEKVPWIAPTFGYMSVSQSGDRTAEGSPAAFAASQKAFMFGFHLSGMPFAIKGKHGPLIQARYHYLTTGQASKNSGSDYLAGIGYGYKHPKFRAGLLYEVNGRTLNSTIPSPLDTTKSLVIDETYKGGGIFFYIEY